MTQFLRRVLDGFYPPACIACGVPVDKPDALCGSCWAETPFVPPHACPGCALPVPQAGCSGCDACASAPPPWERAAAVLLYQGVARALVLRLKHADRDDLARPLGLWLWRAARPHLQPGMIVAPVPLHRTRLARRRYNQSALLAAVLARHAGLEHVPDLLWRTRRTRVQDGMSREERARNLDGAIALDPRFAGLVAGRPVLIVDDVLTTGATLRACAEACRQAGSGPVVVAALARVAPALPRLSDRL
ncbi:MAG: ComF family protein [Rhodobacteraceae bacterium]|nr:ComF family protein [Paracoccaceae bacterium]